VTEPQPGVRTAGVRQIEVDPEAAGTRLDQFLLRLLPGIPRSRVFRLVRKGEVRVNGKRAGPEHRLQERDIVRVPPVRIEPEPAPGQPARLPGKVLETVQTAIVSEDPRLLVLDKPAGIAVHGGSGLSFGVIEALRAMRPDEELELVHRLDRDTSGCLLVARKRSALRTLHELLREGLVEKRYLTLVKGHWNLGHTKIDQPLRTDTRTGGERHVRVHVSGKEALSEFKPIQWFGNQATLLEVSLHTGRTHQIRVHAAHVGHPVAGDEKYGDEGFNAEMKAAGLGRMFLHSHSVSFEWPQGAHGGLFSASAPLPAELSSVIDFLTGPGVRTASRPPRWNSSESSSGERRPRARPAPRPAASDSPARTGESNRGTKKAAAPAKRASAGAGRGGDRSRSGSRAEDRGGGRRGGRQRTGRHGKQVARLSKGA
jgi:23S rRNA pseudouridine955/2504/2580 synthase